MKIQPVNEVLSLFGMSPVQQALNKKTRDSSLVAAFVSAFFIILISGMILSLSAKTSPFSSQPVVAAEVGHEAVAFQPGRMVSDHLSQGYIGR